MWRCAMEQNLEEKIRQRAYERWEQEGRPDGRDRDHWHQAEAEIKSVRSRAALLLGPGPAKETTLSADRGT